MYGKETRLRFAKETVWGQAPATGWVGVSPLAAAVSLSGRADTQRYVNAAAPGAVYAVATFEAAAAEGDIVALSDAALKRDGDGQIASYTIQAADAGGAREVRGAVVRRFKMKSGIARPALEFLFEFVGKATAPAAAFDASGGGTHFTFPGAEVRIDTTAVAAKEFSINLNNNIFIGPTDDDNDPAFFSAGRQELTGYIIAGDDRRDLVDGDDHPFEITLPGDAGDAVIAAGAVFFTWCREIRSAAAGALQVLYFEGAAGGVTSGLSVALS